MLNVAKICSPELKGAHQVQRWQWTRLCSLTFCLLSLNILILVRICIFFHSDEMHTFFSSSDAYSPETHSFSKPYCLSSSEDRFLRTFYFLRKDTGNEFLIVKTWVLLGLFKGKKRRSFLFIFLVEN